MPKEFTTAPYDPRFPNQNQQKACYMYYIDYHRCKKIKGMDYEPCDYLQKLYKTICPAKRQAEFDEWRDNKVFPTSFDIYYQE